MKRIIWGCPYFRKPPYVFRWSQRNGQWVFVSLLDSARPCKARKVKKIIPKKPLLVCLRLWNISTNIKDKLPKILALDPWMFVFHLGVLLRFLWHQRPRFDGSHSHERRAAPEGTHEVCAQGASLVLPGLTVGSCTYPSLSPTPQKDAEFGKTLLIWPFWSTLGLR